MSITTSNMIGSSQRLRASYSPRLLLSELLLKQWFEPVIPFVSDARAARVFCGDGPGVLWI